LTTRQRRRDQVWSVIASAWIARVVIGLVLAALFVLYLRSAFSRPYDFAAYYDAAVNLWQDRTPYADALAWKAAGYATGSPQLEVIREIPYVYPPTLALAMLPLTALPIELARVVWLALLYGCVAGTAWCLAALATERRDTVFWLAVALLALTIAMFKPVRGALTFSKQVDPAIMLLLAATALAFVRRRDGWAGVLFGLAVSIKPFVVVLALFLLWKGAYRATIVAGMVSAVLALGPLLALGLLGEYLEVSAYWTGPTQAASPVGQSVYSLLLRTLTVQPYTVPLIEAPWLVRPLRVMVAIVVLGVVLACVQRDRQQAPIVQVLEFGLGVATMLVISPLTEEHHLAYLTIGLTATVLTGLSRWNRSAGARWILWATAGLIGVLMLPGTHLIAWGFYWYREAPIAPPLSLATFFFLYALLAAAALNLLALRLVRDHGRDPDA
jgi:hypothetical protein